MIDLIKYALIWFMNPLFIWLFILLIGSKYNAKESSIKTFGKKLDHVGVIYKEAIPYALLIGIILSLIFYIFEFSFSFNFIVIYMTLVVLLTFNYHLNKLSALYTVGLAVVLYYFITQKHLIIMHESGYYLVIILLLVFLLVLEGTMYYTGSCRQFNIQYVKSKESLAYQFQKIMVVPVFLMVPVDVMTNIGLSFFVPEGQDSIYLLLPIVIGAEQKLKQIKDLSLMRLKAFGIYGLAFMLMLGLLIPYELRLTVIMFTIVLRIALELFIYFKAQEKQDIEPLELLFIKKNSLADYFKLEVGYVITHIDDIPVKNKNELKALLYVNSGHLEVTLKNHLEEKIKIVINSFQSDSELGIIVLGKPEVI